MRRSALLLASAVIAVFLASGMAWAATVRCSEVEFSKCVGTGGPDTIYGSDDDVGDYGDWIVGRAGDDELYGRGGDDREREFGGGLYGGDGDDAIHGGDGDDSLFGDRGTDRVFGGRGADLVTGETHNFVGPAPGDLLAGGPGDDELRARDGQKDRVYCGTGVDEVFADDSKKSGPNDTGVRDRVDDSCEKVDRY